MIVQRDFRWRNDDGSQSTATWRAALNTPIETDFSPTLLRLRFAVTHELGDTPLPLQLQRNINSGGWVNVTSVSPFVRAILSGNVTEAEATTQQISSPDTFQAGEVDEASGAVSGGTLVGGDTTVEHEFVIESDPGPGRTVQFRLIVDGGGVLDGYTNLGELTTSFADVNLGSSDVSAPSRLLRVGTYSSLILLLCCCHEPVLELRRSRRKSHD